LTTRPRCTLVPVSAAGTQTVYPQNFGASRWMNENAEGRLEGENGSQASPRRTRKLAGLVDRHREPIPERSAWTALPRKNAKSRLAVITSRPFCVRFCRSQPRRRAKKECTYMAGNRRGEATKNAEGGNRCTNRRSAYRVVRRSCGPARKVYPKTPWMSRGDRENAEDRQTTQARLPPLTLARPEHPGTRKPIIERGRKETKTPEGGLPTSDTPPSGARLSSRPTWPRR
jgi:hypothetical protein